MPSEHPNPIQIPQLKSNNNSFNPKGCNISQPWNKTLGPLLNIMDICIVQKLQEVKNNEL